MRFKKINSLLCVLSVLCGTLSPAAFGAVKSVRFDSGVRGNLPYTFSRALATCDDDGNAVASGQMRFGRARAVPRTPAWSTETIPVTTGFFFNPGLQCGQYDFDGSTGLTLAIDSGDGVKVFRGAADFQAAAITSRNTTRTDKATNSQDLLKGLANQETNCVYIPKSVLVCHGAIFAFCKYSDWTGAIWSDDGVAVLYSQDYGATWTLHYKSAVTQANWNRGAQWSMASYYPADATPKDVWISFVDYKTNPGSTGGLCGVFRMTRAGAGQQWTVQNVFEVYSDAVAGRHFHGACVAIKPALGRIDVVMSFGDGNPNRNARRICNDPANYTNNASWAATDLSFGHSASDPELGVDSFLASQWVCCPARGFASSEFYVRCDLEYTALWKMTVPDDPVGKVQFEAVLEAGVYHPPVQETGLWLRCVAPERGGPFFGFNNFNSAFEPADGTAQGNRRVIYSQDGVYWTFLADIPPVANLAQRWNTPFWHAGRLYLVSQAPCNTTPTPYLVPSTMNLRPLRIGPGSWGTKNFVAVPQAEVAGYISDGWLTNSHTRTWSADGSAYSPKPPCLGPVCHHTSTGTNQTKAMYGEATELGPHASYPADYVPAGKYCFRYWMRNRGAMAINADDRLVHWNRGLWGNVLNGRVFERNWRPAAIPIGDYLNFDVVYFELHGSIAETDVCYPMDRDAAIDLMIGHATEQPYAGYSMAPGATGPDELFAVQIPGAGTQWTASISAFVPVDSWSSELKTMYSLTTPLATVFKDANNYVYVSADLPNNRLHVDVDAAGSVTSANLGTILFHPGDPLKIAVSQSGSGVEISAQIGGGTIYTATIAATMGAPAEIRFARPDNSRAAAIDLAAVTVNDSTFSNAAARQAVMAEPSWSVPRHHNRSSVDVGIGN